MMMPNLGVRGGVGFRHLLGEGSGSLLVLRFYTSGLCSSNLANSTHDAQPRALASGTRNKYPLKPTR